MRSRTALCLLATTGALAWAPRTWAQQAYYVSPTGNDSNDGLTPATAWASLTKVDSATFAPGSNILFQDGGNWYGQLIASSSGTSTAPIIYGSYGTGVNPTFWGSDPVAASAFTAVGGFLNTYVYPDTTPVNSFFVDHQFARSAVLISNQTTDAGNISYVENNPNTWYYSPATRQLYVNTGGPIDSSHVYTVATRQGLVESNYQSNVTFQNLTVQESANYAWGYGFYAIGGANVSFINDDAVACAKHAFAAIDTQNFLGTGLTASNLMPDQGFGGASAFVTYSDYNMVKQNTPSSSSWINCTFTNSCGVDNSQSQYEAFWTHGDPGAITSLTVQNMCTDAPLGIGLSGVDADEKITITGGQVNSVYGLSIYAAQNVAVSGMRFINCGFGICGTSAVLSDILGTVSVSYLNVDATSLLDVGKQAVVISYAQYGSADPYSTMRGLVISGYVNHGYGITSSAADSRHGVGIIDQGGKVTVGYAVLGDANMDGTVGFTDLVAVAQHYNVTGTDWATGDFNYDNVTDFSDLVKVAQNYKWSLTGEQTGELNAIFPSFAADWALAEAEVVAVPEPALLGLAVVGSVVVMARWRR